MNGESLPLPLSLASPTLPLTSLASNPETAKHSPVHQGRKCVDAEELRDELEYVAHGAQQLRRVLPAGVDVSWLYLSGENTLDTLVTVLHSVEIAPGIDAPADIVAFNARNISASPADLDLLVTRLGKRAFLREQPSASH